MGSSSSKAARTLSKSTPSTSSSTANATGAAARAGPSSSSRPAQARSQPSQPAPSASQLRSDIPVDDGTLRQADDLGGTGRQAAPLNRDGRIGPMPGRSEGGSEVKDAAVRRDAFDPHFVNQLNNLGPVQTPSPTSALQGRPGQSQPHSPPQQQQPSQMTRILRARQEREERLEAERERAEAGSNTTTRPGPPGALPHSSLDVQTLSMLLDERKACRSPSDLQRLAREYDVNLTMLEGLTKRFNSPSIGRVMDSPEEQRRKREGSDTTPVRMLGVWTEPDIRVEEGRVEPPKAG